MPKVPKVMNTPEEILDASASYIRIIFAAIPCCVLYNMASGVLRALGDSKTPVLFLILASLVNIVLDLLLIIVFRMDVAGAAVATAISQLVSGIGCVLVMRRRFPILRLRPEDKHFSLPTAGKMLGVGLPMGLQFSITAIGSVMLQTSVNGLGVNAVAAVTAAEKIRALFACVIDSLAATMATFAGQNLGARKLNRVHEGLRDAGIIGTGYCVLALVVILLFARPLLSLFVDNQSEAEVTVMGARFLSTNAAFYVPLLFVNIVRLSIQGMGFTRIAMIAGMFEMIARTAVALFLVPAIGFTGACFANPAAWVLADLFVFPCYFHIMRSLQEKVIPAANSTRKPA